MNTDTEILRIQAESEARFFDRTYAAAVRQQEKENYIVPTTAINKVIRPANPLIDDHEYAYSLLGNLKDKHLLDYAAGDGWNTVCFAKAGAKVWAIDISPVGVDLVRKRAKSNGVEDSVRAEVRNCYNTEYDNDMFDIIFGGGILHHLQDLDSAGKELSRIMKNTGVAVFYEPVRETKIMDSIKAIVLSATKIEPSDTTENERPLDTYRIDILKKYFRVVNRKYFQVLSSAKKVLANGKAIYVTLLIDHYLIKYVPLFKKLGRLVVIELREPI